MYMSIMFNRNTIQEKFKRTSKSKKCLDKRQEVKDKQFIDLKYENEKLKDEIIRLKDDNKTLQKQINKTNDFLLKKATNKTNTTINNTVNNTLNYMPTEKLNLTDENIKTVFENKYDEKVFKSGVKGLVKFIHNNFIKGENGENKVICTDLSRYTFRY